MATSSAPWITVTRMVALRAFLPAISGSLDVAVMTAVPPFTPVTTPFSSTEATSGLLDDQVTSWYVASDGVIFIFSGSLLPPTGTVSFLPVMAKVPMRRYTCTGSSMERVELSFMVAWAVTVQSPTL